MIYSLTMTSASKGFEVLAKAAVAVFFAALFLGLTVPLFDPDLWWHLATGKWMWENGSLMSEDPFNFTYFSSAPQMRTDFVLRQYWVTQLLFYGAYSVGGYKSLLLLRAGSFTLLFYLLYALMRNSGAARFLCLPLVYLAATVTIREFTYIGAKPQMFTSLFSVLAVYLLEQMRQGRKAAFPALPALMLLWSNMHGGFIFGDLIILTYLAAALAFRTGGRRFVLASVVALIAGGINPNGLNAFRIIAADLFQAEAVQYGMSIVEGQSIFRHASLQGIVRSLPHYAGLTLLSFTALALSIRRSLKHNRELVMLYFLVFAMGLVHIRFIIFFASIAAVVAAIGLRDIFVRMPSGAVFSALRKGGYAAGLALSLVLCFFLAKDGVGRTALGYEKPFVDDFGGAPDFLEQNGLRGNVFNDYNHGGYLIWRLAPDIRVFADGRAIYHEGFELYRKVVDSPYVPTAPGDPRPIYESTLDRYNINIVVLPGCDKASGVTIPLSYVLLQDSKWHVVFADRESIVFMRPAGDYRRFVLERSIDKRAGYENILFMAGRAMSGGHAHMVPGVRLSLAIGFMGTGDRQNALYWINQYLELRPNDMWAAELLYRIKRM